MRMLIGELIYEVGTSAFEVGVENGPERVMETDSGECTRLTETDSGRCNRLAAIQEDGDMTTTAKDQQQLDGRRRQKLAYMDELRCDLGYSSDARDLLRILRMGKSCGYVIGHETGDVGMAAVEIAHAHEGKDTQRSGSSMDAGPAMRGRQRSNLYIRARAQREEMRWRGSRGFRYHARLADMGRALVERG